MEYPAAFVVMQEVNKKVDEDDNTPFNSRLKGSKILFDKATCALEVTPEYMSMRTKWTVWKSRSFVLVGSTIYTGYDRGRFVPYTAEYKKKVADFKDKKLEWK